MPNLAYILIFIGVAFILLGLFYLFEPNIPFLGRLPGDSVIERNNVRLYIPLATSLLLSIILSILFNLFSRR